MSDISCKQCPLRELPLFTLFFGWAFRFDTLSGGLCVSLVQTNKRQRKLERLGLPHIERGTLYLGGARALVKLADLYGDGKSGLGSLN